LKADCQLSLTTAVRYGTFAPQHINAINSNALGERRFVLPGGAHDD
jgi:hypothetical protein